MIIGVPMMSWRGTIALVVCSAALVLLASSRALAQQPEIFAGYSFLVDPDNSVLAVTARDTVYPAGWIAGAAVPFSRAMSFAGEASGYYKTRTTFDQDVTLSFHSAMAGPRASVRIGAITEFAQLLGGVVFGRGSAFGQSASLTAFSLQPGGGVDVHLSRRLSARLQLDYRWLRHSANERPHASQFRAAAAFVYSR